MSKTKLMLGNAVEMSLIFQNPGPLSFGLGPHCFRGPVCSWRKKVSLFPWGYLKKKLFYFSAFIQTDTNHLTYIVGDVSSGIPIEVSMQRMGGSRGGGRGS